MEEGRTAVKEIGGKVVKNVYPLRPAFYYQHRRTNEDFFNDAKGPRQTTVFFKLHQIALYENEICCIQFH